MNRMLAFLAVPLLAFGLSARADSDEETLTNLLEDFLAGASVNDMAAHDRFWDEDLVYTSSSGQRFGKADIMERNRPEEEPADDEPAVVYSAEDIRIRFYGRTAVVAFRLVGKVQGDPPGVMEYFNTGTFVKRNGEWRAVAWQATMIPAKEG